MRTGLNKNLGFSQVFILKATNLYNKVERKIASDSQIVTLFILKKILQTNKQIKKTYD